MEKREQGEAPTIERVMDAFARDERKGRPGPRPPRLNAEVGWQELVRVVVQTAVSPEADAARMHPSGEAHPSRDGADG